MEQRTLLHTSAASPLEDELLFEVAGIDHRKLSAILIGDEIIDTHVSARDLVNNLAGLYDVTQAEFIPLMGISPSRLSKNNEIDKNLLDRAAALTGLYSKVRGVMGDNTHTWFKTPNPALDDLKPLSLLGTQYGRKQVENTVDALLHGAFL